MATQSIQSIITSSLNKGDKGDAGTKGEKGVYIASASYSLANDTVTFTNSDSSTIDFQGVKGAKGNAGDAGSAGAKGDKGDLGDKGNAGDLTAVAGIAESFTSLTGATGTVAHDTSLGTIFYHSSVSANFTANFTNVDTTNSRTRVIALILVQGSTAYMPTAVQINGTSQTIRWAGGSVPTGTSSGVNVVSFSLIRSAGTWLVLGQSSVF